MLLPIPAFNVNLSDLASRHVFKISKLALLLTALPIVSTSVQADMFDELIDPKDGQLDASSYILNNAHGFMPVPFLITEPAVGTGGGVALLFFHETDEQKAIRLDNPDKVSKIPPSVTGVVGGATSNGSKLAGVFHSGNWKNDNIRYIGGLFGGSFNLKYYSDASNIANDFNIEGLYFLQDIDFRLGESNFFLGGSYVNMGSNSTFDFSGTIPGIDPIELDSKDASVAVKLTYDSRDNQFSPRDGLKAGIKASFHHENLGGDFDYHEYNGFVQSYYRIAPKWGLGIRGDIKSVSEGVPFYAKPFLDMRGIPAMRYQGESTALAEVELSYDIDERWTVLGFAGTGKAIEDDGKFEDADWQTSKGAGFRYLIARQLGLRTGIDIAKGPEEWTMYIQFGGAWH
ncbi:BamA/TamA family outer membrane protein [Shewanella sp. UCD-KL12]|uniref:BamA/TamA family outer membrane protein n=1 Tax=Shewanella sp. UCD-KL12 TaxID=1917163 RepID=UPI001C4B2D44|nr:BamA/TamA family outer membrane protein [Shewanella sp. UCD-KL12]